MPLLRHAAAVALLLALASPLAAQTRLGREQTLQRSGAAGQPIRIFAYGQWRSDCSPEEPPRIVLRTQPAHGSISVRMEEGVVSAIRQGAVDCSGHSIPTNVLYYLSQPGYRGTDQFDYDVLTKNSPPRHDTALLTIR